MTGFASTLRKTLKRHGKVLRQRRSFVAAVALAVLGPVLALTTYALLSGANHEVQSSIWFRALILADVVYLVALTALIGIQIARLIIARRAGSAGSKLHGRMVAFFTGVAAAPAILTALFFFLVIQLGFEAWFSQQMRSIVHSSSSVAQAYAVEHRAAMRGKAESLASRINREASLRFLTPDNREFERLLRWMTEESDFSDIYVVNSSGEIIARGANTYRFTYTPPPLEDFTAALDREVVIREDPVINEMRGLVKLHAFLDSFLYVTRPVDGDVLSYQENAEQGTQLYNRLEENREEWLAQFAALYLGFVVLVLMAAIYFGLWFAERLAKPIGRLAQAAQRVGSGDLVARVKEERGDDEIALLSRTFNQMTSEVKRKQDALEAEKASSEARRQFTEAVLSGVSAGVVGLDDEGHVRLVNGSAEGLLDITSEQAIGKAIQSLVPELAHLFAQIQAVPTRAVSAQMRLLRKGAEREINVRISAQLQRGPEGKSVSGYVVTVDDLTDLVAAQRMAAWGDVARRIAHEIKNPLTPIQLAAERLRRKFADRLGEDAPTLERYTETIVRQTADIGRMVDAFVKFAKLPAPTMAHEKLADIVSECVSLQKEARAQIEYSIQNAAAGAYIRCDRGQITQALTNLLQNAADAMVSARLAGIEIEKPMIRVAIKPADERVVIEVSDNGVGLPEKDRLRLLEPYVTTRAEGTGLGLAMVMKIIEEHSGEFALCDADPFGTDGRRGACARIVLPIAQSLEDTDVLGSAQNVRRGAA
ncbi:MAG: PAS domain-containing sensor histidine kinase [Neomegalonema sp.]|nr:PAS domain-containing sensor histidine kinase [Neomegalonema sp.]